MIELTRRAFLKGLAVAAAIPFLPKVVEAAPTVDNLLDKIRARLQQIAEHHLFEPNDRVTRESISSMSSAYLQSLCNTRQITKYLVTCNDTNNPPSVVDRNEVYVDVILQPARSVEFVNLKIKLG